MSFKKATRFTLVSLLGIAAVPLPARALETGKTAPHEEQSLCNPDERYLEGHCILDGELLRMVQPIYPRVAERKGIEATVRLEAIIGKDGSVMDVEVVECTREGFGFEKAAIRAVRRWQFRPFLVDGEVGDVTFETVVEFKMGSTAIPPATSALKEIRNRGRELAA